MMNFDALLELEKSREDVSFVILSDIWLNDINVSIYMLRQFTDATRKLKSLLQTLRTGCSKAS